MAWEERVDTEVLISCQGWHHGPGACILSPGADPGGRLQGLGGSWQPRQEASPPVSRPGAREGLTKQGHLRIQEPSSSLTTLSQMRKQAEQEGGHHGHPWGSQEIHQALRHLQRLSSFSATFWVWAPHELPRGGRPQPPRKAFYPPWTTLGLLNPSEASLQPRGTPPTMSRVTGPVHSRPPLSSPSTLTVAELCHSGPPGAPGPSSGRVQSGGSSQGATSPALPTPTQTGNLGSLCSCALPA